MTSDDRPQVTDTQVERARFTFIFDPDMAALLGPERMAALVGSHINFRWGTHVADGEVQAVALDPETGMYSVTMEIEADLEPDQSLSFSGQPSMTIHEA